jgi:hypothetical protein
LREASFRQGIGPRSAYARAVQRLLPLVPSVACLALACASQSGTSPPARATPPAGLEANASNTSASSAPPDTLRELGPDATFADLVRAARVIAQHDDGEPDARCVLAEAATGYRLDADLMSALEPIPDPPAELDSTLQRHPGPLAVLSAWGVLGSPDAALALSAFTATPPQRLRAAPSALLLTESGAYLRSGAGRSSEDDGPLPPEGALARLETDQALASGPLFVSAEAAVPLSALAALLQALPAKRAVALAVALPAGTRLPAPSAGLGALACEAGLPEPAGERAEGEIDAAALSAVLRSLVPAGERCLQSARGPGRAGGTLTVALRIAEAGGAEHACIVSGELRDPVLAGCVLDALRAARYPTPSPPGFVDVHAPLRLEPASWPEPQPYCRAGQ